MSRWAIHPYTGPRQREHFPSRFGDGDSIDRYGDDESGQIAYRFNSAGYRGEEFDPAAARLVLVCGCSLTFGVGVSLGESWPDRFKHRYAESLGCAPDSINLLNLSQGGCSNDYIARTLLAQSSSLPRPDLVVVQFTYACRTEGVSEEHAFDIGPWMVGESVTPGQEDIAERVRGYFLYYADEIGVSNTLKNMLLLQLAYARANTPYVFCWVEGKFFDDPRFTTHPIVEPLLRQLDRSRICPVSLADSCCDWGADGAHPGPRTHDVFAARLFAFYESLR